MSSSAQAHVYRPGASIVPLFFWAVLTGVASFMLVKFATDQPPSPEAKGLACLIAVFGVLFGPVAFIAHFIRLCLVSVAVFPDEGLVLGKNRKVGWQEIRSVEHREAAFKDLIRVNPALLFFTAGCMAVVYFVVLPSFALFTPWHSRVLITLKGGQTLILRDLAGADEFVREVSRHLT
jgi:hypothetical protein